MPTDPWAEFEEVTPQAPAPSAPRPIISVPDYRGRDDARGDAQLQLGQSAEARAGRNEADQNLKDSIQNAQTLKGSYEALTPIKEYRAILPQLIQSLDLPEDPTADTTLLYNYAKVMDPGSVVRESEQGMAAGGASVFDGAVANLKKQLGIEGGGSLTPEVRQRLKRDMLQRVQGMGKAYRQQRQRYTADAQAYGIDPARVIGPDDFDPYVDEFNRLRDREAQKAGTGASTGLNAPQQKNGLYPGETPEFGMDKWGQPDSPFDREQALRAMGINGDQESRMVAFWNQNRNNPNLTPETAKQWFQASGIPAPSDAAIAETIDKLRKGFQIGNIDTSGAEQAYRQDLRASNAERGFDPSGAGGYAARAAQGAAFGLTDEVYGLVGGLDALINNRGVADGYTRARDETRQAFDDMAANQGALGTAAELAGGLAGGFGVASRAPLTAARAATEGAAAGALAGYGYGEGLGDSLGSAALGGATGAGLGYGIGRGVEALAARRAAQAGQPLSEGGQVIAAADRLNNQFGTNIAPIPADVGGAATRRATGGAAQLPLSAGPIVRGAENVSSEAKAARDAIARLNGTVATDEAAGEAALTGAQKYIRNSQTKVRSLYAQAEKLGGKEAVDLANARQVLDDNIAEMSQTPGGAPGLARLQSLRATLDQPYPVEGVKRMRTTLNDEFMGDGLRNSDLQRRVGQVVDAAEIDVADSLAAAGKGDAAKAYQEAAAAHKERVGVIDDVLAPIIGRDRDNPNSVEQVMRAIDSATKTNGAKLGRFLSSLPPEDAETVRATLISRLGSVGDGRQNAAGDAFSLNDFLTHWNKLSSPAKSQLFGGETRAALEDLAKVAEGTKEAQRFANSSNTGGAVGLVVSGGVASEFFNKPIRTALFFVPQHVGGKLLASPKFARWLAKMPSQPAAIERHVSALTKIAANDNAIAQDVLGLKSALEGVLGQLGGSAKSAAAPTPQTGSTEPGERR